MTDASDLLAAAGWHPGRRVDISGELRALEQAGHPALRAAAEVLTEYADLVVVSASGDRSLWISGTRAAAESDVAWCMAYSGELGLRLVPVGGHSHMTILVDEAGRFWGGFDYEYGRLGDTVEDVIQGVLIATPPVQFDRRLET
jgi:hypothetical protein